jgi:hypothetical protein
MFMAPVSRSTRVRGPASSYSSTSDDESNSRIADGYGTPRAAQLAMAYAVGDLPTSSVSALQLVSQTLVSRRAPTHPVKGVPRWYDRFGRYGIKVSFWGSVGDPQNRDHRRRSLLTPRVGRRMRSTSLSAPGARAKGAAGLRRSSLRADEKHCTGPSCPWEAGPLSSALACDAC